MLRLKKNQTIKKNQVMKLQKKIKRKQSPKQSGPGSSSTTQKLFGSDPREKSKKKNTQSFTNKSQKITKTHSLTLISQLRATLNSNLFFSFLDILIMTCLKITTVRADR